MRGRPPLADEDWHLTLMFAALGFAPSQAATMGITEGALKWRYNQLHHRYGAATMPALIVQLIHSGELLIVEIPELTETMRTRLGIFNEAVKAVSQQGLTLNQRRFLLSAIRSPDALRVHSGLWSRQDPPSQVRSLKELVGLTVLVSNPIAFMVAVAAAAEEL